MPAGAPALPDGLLKAVRAIESRGSSTADLPPLSEGAHEAAKAGLRLLRVRARSRHELRARLRQKELSESVVDEAMDRFEAWGLLDDAEFAREWVRSRRLRRGKASGALRRELEAKGVAARHIDEAVADLDPEADRVRAAELVCARLERITFPVEEHGPEVDKAMRRLVTFLERRGFPQTVALSVVREELAAVRP